MSELLFRIAARLRTGLFASLLSVSLLAACGGTDKKPYVEQEVADLYSSAMRALENGAYAEAAREFEEVERQHPYSIWATKAQLMAAYAHYERNKYGEAILGLNRFVQLHPGNPDVAYAYYLKALSYYEQIADVKRDQQITAKATKALAEVVRRFPKSKYARDAKLKLDLTNDHLAGKEMAIGRYYLTKKHYLAAINRFRIVVDKYQTTTHTPEALHRLVEAYTALGLVDEAKKSASILGHNFPGSEWYIDTYSLAAGVDVREKDKRGFLRRSWDWVF